MDDEQQIASIERTLSAAEVGALSVEFGHDDALAQSESQRRLAATG